MRRKVKAIFTLFLNSIIPQDHFYPKLLHTPLFHSLRYYSVIIVGSAGILVALLFIRHSPARLIEYKSAVISAIAQFPVDAELRIHNGELSSNMNRPLFLWVNTKNKPLFTFIADTQDTSTQFLHPAPFIFLKNNGFQVSFRQFDHFWSYQRSDAYVISRQNSAQFEKQADRFFSSLVIYYFVFLFFILPLLFIIISTLAIVISGVIAFLILRIYSSRVHLRKCIQAGLHGTHIPIFITVLFLNLFPLAPRCLFVVGSIFFVFTLVSSFEMYSKEEINHRSGR